MNQFLNRSFFVALFVLPGCALKSANSDVADNGKYPTYCKPSIKEKHEQLKKKMEDLQEQMDFEKDKLRYEEMKKEHQNLKNQQQSSPTSGCDDVNFGANSGGKKAADGKKAESFYLAQPNFSFREVKIKDTGYTKNAAEMGSTMPSYHQDTSRSALCLTISGTFSLPDGELVKYANLTVSRKSTATPFTVCEKSQNSCDYKKVVNAHKLSGSAEVVAYLNVESRSGKKYKSEAQIDFPKTMGTKTLMDTACSDGYQSGSSFTNNSSPTNFIQQQNGSSVPPDQGSGSAPDSDSDSELDGDESSYWND